MISPYPDNTPLDPVVAGFFSPSAAEPAIDAIHPELAIHHSTWAMIRNVVRGSASVKRCGEALLPRATFAQTDPAYQRFLQTTSFYPATNRTAQGRRGLMFAKNVVLDCPTLESIKEAISPDGSSIRELAENVVWETLQTNFTGLLVDHPEAPNGVIPTAATAIEQGYRPYIHLYPAETILWINYKDIGGSRKPVRIVLREAYNRILELLLDDAGTYRQNVWEKADGEGMRQTRSVVPVRNGAPLNEIPWVTVSESTAPWPQQPVLQDIAELNLDHYRASGRVTHLSMFGSGVVPVITGIQMDRDDAGKPIVPDIPISTGGIIALEDPQAKAFYMEPQGNMAKALADEVQNIEERMAKIAARILAPERVAPEAEPTVLMRSAAEDAVTASLAQNYATRISKALSWCSWWMGGDKATFTLNTDYRNRSMSAQDLTAWTAAYLSNAVSFDTYFYRLRDEGVVNSTLTPEQERQRIADTVIDQPPVDVPVPALTGDPQANA